MEPGLQGMKGKVIFTRANFFCAGAPGANTALNNPLLKTLCRSDLQ
jgi:hypothetical protein